MNPIPRRLALIAGVGLATGVLSQLAQDLLPEAWSQVGNAISPWLLVAFLLGSAMPDRRWAAGAGVGALVPLVVGRAWPDRLGGYLATVPALALGALGFVVFIRIADLTAGIG